VTDQDAGGADIVISYTPLNNGDPTSVNFLQAFIQDTNGTGFNTGTIDNDASASPYYNSVFISGTGKTDQTGTVPLATNKTTAAWLVDIPFRCENGPVNPGGTAGCLGGTDDTIISQVQTFQTLIESDQVCSADACGDNKGKTYQVLYGGVQWGYTYTNADVPEPS
jgi:hypothetical protein